MLEQQPVENKALHTRYADNGRQEVFDPLRRRWVALTPEEHVRQLFVRYLSADLHYPQGLMANEVELRIGDKRIRCDTVVYDRHLHPLMVVEYKSPAVTLTQQVADQVMAYNRVLRAPLLVITNGRQMLCWRADYETATCSLLDRLPDYEELGRTRPS